MRRLSLALRAYPRRVRDAEGDVLLGLAQDLADGPSSVSREAFGLVRGGLTARAGALGRAPWDDALGRLAVPLAVAFTGLIWGRAAQALSSGFPAWPGWGWVVTLIAPVLALVGLLARRRAPAATGALLLVVIGVAQANGRPATTAHWFTGYLEWSVQGTATVGYAIAGLGCAIPGALILLAATLRLPYADRRGHRSAAAAWAVAGALGVFLADGQQLTIAGLHLDGVGLALAGYGVAAVGFASVVLARRDRREPGASLAAVLALATTAPVVALYGLGSPHSELVVLLGAAALAGCTLLLHAAAIGSRA